MTNNQVILQSRNVDHYVIKALIRNDPDYFYTQELQLRKEMGFSPFKHWVQITARAKIEASALECVSLFYKELLKTTDKTYVLTQPKADGMARKRGQYRFNVMVQGDDIVVTMDVVKAALAKVKRPSRVIVTLNVDP